VGDKEKQRARERGRESDNVLQCVAVCCSMLQYVAVYCSVLQYARYLRTPLGV